MRKAKKRNNFLDFAKSLDPSTGAVNGVKKCFHMVRFGELRDAVPQVEDMPCCVCVIGEGAQDRLGFAGDDGGFGEQRGWVPVALQGPPGANTAPGFPAIYCPAQAARPSAHRPPLPPPPPAPLV